MVQQLNHFKVYAFIAGTLKINLLTLVLSVKLATTEVG